MTRAGTALRVVCAVSACLALGGCGGSGGGEGSEDPADARAEFLAEGDALCAEGQAEAADLARRAQEIQAGSGSLSEDEVLEQAAAVWADQVRFIERFRDRVADLEPPPGDEPRVEEFIESLDDGLTIGREIHASLEDGEEPSAELVQSYGHAVTRGNTLAQAYGFTVCGRTG